MKIFASLTAATLFLFLFSLVPSYSQDRDEARPQAQEDKVKDKVKDKDKDKGARPNEGRRDDDRPGMRQEEHREPAAARPQEEPRPKEQQREDRDRHDQHQMDRNNQAHPEHAKQGKRIPDDRFRANFGHEHRFRARQVITTTTIVPGQTRFVYSGYSFIFIDAWPAEWAFDDECYVDYIDGEYFLINPFHPGFRVAVMVVE
jgi:hypothetical protein